MGDDDIDGILTPEKARKTKKGRPENVTTPPKGVCFNFRTGPELGEVKVDPLPFKQTKSLPNNIDSSYLQNLLHVVQSVTNGKTVSSNRAEVFNSLHDRDVQYKGRKNVYRAMQRLKAWVVLRFHRRRAQETINSSIWNHPPSTLQDRRVRTISRFHRLLL